MSELYATDIGGIWGVMTGTALLGTADVKRNYSPMAPSSTAPLGRPILGSRVAACNGKTTALRVALW